MSQRKKIRKRRWDRSGAASDAIESLSNGLRETPKQRQQETGAETGRALLEWYDREARDLPWRRTRDPYRVLVSEVMLQQTRTAVVLRYYDAFLSAFPSVEELAAADETEVLARWSGLGYYQRARRLHAAAREVVGRGGFPHDVRALQELPGIGPYTAAAVASIAFGEVVPVLDGNVERALCRWLGCEQDPRRAAVRRALCAVAREWLDPQRAGCSNQALMELGATVCTSRAPSCDLCPLAAGCWAREHGCAESLPRRAPSRPRVRVRLRVAVLEHEGRILLVHRPADAQVLPGLWELPSVDRESVDGESLDGDSHDGAHDGAEAFAPQLAARFGGALEAIGAPTRVRHAITYRDLEVTVQRFRLHSGPRRGREAPSWVAEGAAGAAHEYGWFRRAEIAELPTSSLVAKALALCP